MDANWVRERWHAYLAGKLPADERARIDAFLEQAEASDVPEVVPESLRTLLRTKLRRETAPAGLRSRILAALGATEGAPVPAGTSAAPARPGWLQRVFGSPWTPRLAMAAVLVLLLLIPLQGFLRPPAVAVAAVERHDCHAETASLGSPMPSCCEDLHLHAGAALPEPARGGAVPDLSRQGFDLVATTRCNYGGTTLIMLIYRDAAGTPYSLYVTDRLQNDFRRLRRHESHGIVQASHVVRDRDVTIWERQGLVYFWIGPKGASGYQEGLGTLQHAEL